jgi:hypothetical protein
MPTSEQVKHLERNSDADRGIPESKPAEWEPKGSKGTGATTNEWILGGWSQQHKGKADDGRHEILEVWTYDRHRKMYRGWGFITPGGDHFEATGAWRSGDLFLCRMVRRLC